MKKALAVYDKVLEYILAVSLGFVVVVLFAEIVLRTVGITMVWAQEAARYIYLWIIYIGSAVALQKKRHLVIDLLSSKLSGKPKYILNIAIDIVVIAFLVFVTYYGFAYAQQNDYQLGYAIKWFHMSWAYASVPVGAIMLIISIVREIAEYIDAMRREEG